MIRVLAVLEKSEAATIESPFPLRLSAALISFVPSDESLHQGRILSQTLCESRRQGHSVGCVYPAEPVRSLCSNVAHSARLSICSLFVWNGTVELVTAT